MANILRAVGIHTVDMFHRPAVRNYLANHGLEPLFLQISQQQHCPAPFFYSVGQHTLLCYELVPRFITKEEIRGYPDLNPFARHYIYDAKYGVLLYNLGKAFYDIDKIQDKILELRVSSDREIMVGLDAIADLPWNLDMEIQSEAKIITVDAVWNIIHQINEEACTLEINHFNNVEESSLIEEMQPADVYNRLIRLYTNARAEYLAD